MPIGGGKKRKRSKASSANTLEGSGDNTDQLSIIERQDMDVGAQAVGGEPVVGNVDHYYAEENRRTGTKFNAKMNAFVVGCMSLEVDSGRAPNGVFNKTTWPRIHKKFNRKFKTNYSEKQISALHRRIKQDYNTWQYLLDHTGFGWDEQKKVPLAPLDKWVQVDNIRHNAMKFRKEPLAHQAELHKIFGSNVATGNYQCFSTHAEMSDDEEDDHVPLVATDVVPPGAANQENSTSTRSSDGRKNKGSVQPGSLNASRKKKGRRDYFDDAMQAISESSVWRGEKDKAIAKFTEHHSSFSTPPPPDTDPETVFALMLGLKSEAGLCADEVNEAAATMRDMYNRRLFKVMDNEHRIAYMRKFRNAGIPPTIQMPVHSNPNTFTGNVPLGGGSPFFHGEMQHGYGFASQAGGFGNGYVVGFPPGFGGPASLQMRGTIRPRGENWVGPTSSSHVAKSVDQAQSVGGDHVMGSVAGGSAAGGSGEGRATDFVNDDWDPFE